jgi:hypothetical protein
MNMRILLITVTGALFLFSCGGNNTDNNSLEKEKIELERQKLELEKQKLNSNNNNSDSPVNDSEKEERKENSNSQPPVREQKDVIRDFYSEFDNAYDYDAMNNYIDRYYSYSLKPTYRKSELPSWNAYNSKDHQIDEIMLIGESEESRRYKVIFYFDFERKNGSSGYVKCADMITLDNNNIIIARSELGKVN